MNQLQAALYAHLSTVLDVYRHPSVEPGEHRWLVPARTGTHEVHSVRRAPNAAAWALERPNWRHVSTTARVTRPTPCSAVISASSRSTARHPPKMDDGSSSAASPAVCATTQEPAPAAPDRITARTAASSGVPSLFWSRTPASVLAIRRTQSRLAKPPTSESPLATTTPKTLTQSDADPREAASLAATAAALPASRWGRSAVPRSLQSFEWRIVENACPPPPRPRAVNVLAPARVAVPMLPTGRPFMESSTRVPPPTEPDLGVTAVTSGVATNENMTPETVKSYPFEVTSTGTVAARMLAPVRHTRELELTKVAGTGWWLGPKRHPVVEAFEKPAPVTATSVPPAMAPMAGNRAVTDAAGTYLKCGTEPGL